MPEPIPSLLLFLVLLLLSLPLIRWAVHAYIRHKASTTLIRARDPLLANLQVGKPALIYFTSQGCVPCRTTQKPIINKLLQEKGDSIQFLTVTIDEAMEDALRWGVMQVPRTFILDANLQVRHSNLGVAQLATLKQQLAEVEI